jgi:hypothetical protein
MMYGSAVAESMGRMKRTFLILLSAALLLLCMLGLWLRSAAEDLRAEAHSQVERWAEQLHSQTTAAGVYLRPPANQLPENDPWGTPLRVTYAQGGFAETLTVRSAGPDRAYYTEDDLLAQRSVVNLRGIGKGVKENLEEMAHHSARGLTKGTVEGIKDTIQEALGRKKPAQLK